MSNSDESSPDELKTDDESNGEEPVQRNDISAGGRGLGLMRMDPNSRRTCFCDLKKCMECKGEAPCLCGSEQCMECQEDVLSLAMMDA